MDTTIRLDKFLANAGVISRRGVKQFLKNNTVTVAGKKVTESGERIPIGQEVLINGKKVQKSGFVYFLLNKPIGIISTTSDELGRDNVADLIDTTVRIYPVGRLDKDSHGLVLLTNDGELTHKLIHPKFHIPKVYRLTIAGIPTDKQLKQLRMGIVLEDGITLPADVIVTKQNPNQTILQITLHEGRNRQIRRMCEEVGLELLDLQRIAFGPLALGNLKKGEYRELTSKEITSLKKAIQ